MGYLTTKLGGGAIMGKTRYLLFCKEKITLFNCPFQTNNYENLEPNPKKS